MSVFVGTLVSAFTDALVEPGFRGAALRAFVVTTAVALTTAWTPKG